VADMITRHHRKHLLPFETGPFIRIHVALDSVAHGRLASLELFKSFFERTLLAALVFAGWTR
jgi:hypothetical protein